MAPGQKVRISTERKLSTIPKSGAGSSWLYPSPQVGPGIACHVILSILNPHFRVKWQPVTRWAKRTSQYYPPRHAKHFEPSFLELNGSYDVESNICQGQCPPSRRHPF